MASRFRQAHNAFDTGRISHPVGWTSGPLDDWHQYARDDFTRKAEWQQNMDKHGRADKGRALLGQDTQKLIVNSLSDNRVAVFDKELHMTIPRFFGHQPNRGPDEDLVSTGAIGAHNWSATMRDKSAIAGRCGSHTRAAAALKGHTSAQLRTMNARELRNTQRTHPQPKRSSSCLPPDKLTVHSSDHRLYPSRYTRRNGTMLWRDFVKADGRRPMMCTTTTAMQQGQEYQPVKTTASPALSNINLTKLGSWPYVKLKKWLGRNGFTKEDLKRCPGKEELLELWRLKQEFESQPKHRSAGDFRAGMEIQAQSIDPGFDHTDMSPQQARHVHAGDYRAGESRSEGAHDRGDGHVGRFFLGHEMGGSSAVKPKGPEFLREDAEGY